MTDNTPERTVELTTVRAAGAGRRTLARMIAAENPLTVTLGFPPRQLIGYLTARAFTSFFTTVL